MTILKKIWKFLSSMTFAILLLVILGVACAVGSFVPQGQSFDWYASTYSETAAAWIIALHLNDAFHSWWFIVIGAFLCGNLLLCNLIRIKSLIQRTKAAGDPDRALNMLPDAQISVAADPEAVMKRLGMPKPAAMEHDGKQTLLSVKNRIGLWGAWTCHLGILLLILGFGLGQMTKTDYTVYGVPGQSKRIGDTDLVLTIDDFRIDMREDDTVEQYTSVITVRDMADLDAEPLQTSISVNNPGRLMGMTYYQNSIGYAVRITVTREGERLQSDIVCSGELVSFADRPELLIYFITMYPDYAYSDETGPYSLSGRMRNPAYLYAVYYNGELLGMNVLMADEQVKIDDYAVTFTDPQYYTLIQVKQDRFTWLAFVGGIVTLIGLLLAFYVQPQTVVAVLEEDGTWTVTGLCKKRGTLYREELERAAGDRLVKREENSNAAD